MYMDKKTVYVLVAVAIIIVLGIIIHQKMNSSNSNAIALDGKLVSPADVAMLYNIANNETLANMVGASVPQTQGTISENNSTKLVVGGKPVVTYTGAEYCPYCAMDRWSMILALMRFGNLTNLHYMTSSASDSPASVPGFTFYNSTYSSNVINFMGVEITTNRIDPATGSYYPLQTLNKIENATLQVFGVGGEIPFIDFGNISIQLGAVTNPKILNGLTQPEIIMTLKNPDSVEAQNIIGGANLFTAKICEITNNTPQSVCDQNYVKTIETYG